MGINIILSIMSLIYCFSLVSICYYAFSIYKDSKSNLNKMIVYTLSGFSLIIILSILILMIVYTVTPYFSSYIFVFNIAFWPFASAVIAFYLCKNIMNKNFDNFYKPFKIALYERIGLLLINLIILSLAIIIFISFCSDKIIINLFPITNGLLGSYTGTTLFKLIIVEFTLCILVLIWNIIKKILLSKLTYSSYSDIIFSLINSIIFLLLIISIKDYQENINFNTNGSLNILKFSYLSWLLNGWMTNDYTNYMATPILLLMLIVLSQILNAITSMIKSLIHVKFKDKHAEVRND